MRPLTCQRPKALVPMLDQPIIAYICAHLQDHGFDRLAVTIGYQGKTIQAYLGESTTYGQQVQYAKEPEPLGTAGGVRNALSRGHRQPFVVVSGDALTDVNLTEALAYHQRHGGVGTLVLSQVDDPSQYGVVETDETGRIVRFVEKPGPAEAFSDRVNTGIYIFDPEVLEHIPAGRFYDFSLDLFPALLAQGYDLYGYHGSGYWSDVGSLEQYLASQFDLLTGRVKVALPGEEVAAGVRVMGEDLLSQQVLERSDGPVFIGKDVQLAPAVALKDGVVLGSGSQVGDGVRLTRTLVFPQVTIGRAAQVEGAILSQGVQVDDGVRIEAGTVVGDGCRVSHHARVPRGSKLWPHHALIGAAAVDQKGAAAVQGDGSSRSATAAVQLGHAFGVSVGSGSRVVIASECDPCSLLARDAVSLGLMTAGVNLVAVDLRYVPAIRFAIRRLQAAGAAYTCLDDNGEASVQLYDEQGLPLAPAAMTDVPAGRFSGHNGFGDGDQAPAPGRHRRRPLLEREYLAHLLQGVHLGAIRNRRWRLVAALASQGGSELFYALAARLNLKLLAVERGPAGGEMLAEAVARKDADLGFELNTAGDAVLVTEDGAVVSGAARVRLWQDLQSGKEADAASLDPLHLLVGLLQRASSRDVAPSQVVQESVVEKAGVV